VETTFGTEYYIAIKRTDFNSRLTTEPFDTRKFSDIKKRLSNFLFNYFCMKKKKLKKIISPD